MPRPDSEDIGARNDLMLFYGLSMDLASPPTLKSLLRKHRIRPNKVLGQHFLISKTVLQRIIESADLKKTDTVLEAGPGLGTLTQALAEHAGRVIAVEKDRALIPILQELFSDCSNVEIIQGDILKFNFSEHFELQNSLFCHSREGGNPDPSSVLPLPRGGLGGVDPRVKPEDDNSECFVAQGKYKIVADIPYYLTSRFLRTFLETPHQPVSLTLLVQKEVASRICARPPHASLLSNAVQYYAIPKIISPVSKSAFFPQPKVDSAILKLTVSRVYDEKADTAFFALLKNAFSSPRKQLFHILSKHYPPKSLGEALGYVGIGSAQRPQEITLEKWVRLAEFTRG